jgi:hypothetical protein
MAGDKEKSEAKKEYEEIKKIVKSTSPQEYKSGGWFLKLIKYALKNNSEKATYEYFQAKYSGLNPDSIVDRRIDLARKYAGVAGATATSAYTGAVAATIGSKGGASPYTVPAATVSLLADMSYVSFLQLRLAYDISVLYKNPLDYEDPEDLHVLLVLAFGIKAGEVFSGGLTKATPEGVRLLIKQFIKKDTLKWLQGLPYVGRYLLQRNIIKSGIPLVGIPISFFVNRFFTGRIGNRAKELFRIKLSIQNVVDDYPIEEISDDLLLLEILWVCISVDKKSSNEETWLLKEFANKINSGNNEDVLKYFADRVNFDLEEIQTRLASKAEQEKLNYLELCYMAITVDGKSNDKEIDILESFCKSSGVKYDKKKVNKYLKLFNHNIN